MWRCPSPPIDTRGGRRRHAVAIAALGCQAILGATAAQAALGARLPVDGGPWCPSANSACMPLWLAVRVNGVDQALITAQALRKGDELALPLDVWGQLHLKPPAAAPLMHEGLPYQRLSSLAGLRWEIDEASQTLVIDAPASAFAGTRVGLDAETPRPAVASTVGGYANYDLQWQRNGAGGAVASRSWSTALVELGGFGTVGTGRVTGLLREGLDMPSWVRLDTSWTIDQPSRMASLRIGDAIGKSGAWGRSLRFGGLQWSTDFSVQPGFLSFPLPSMQGEAVLPSTVDLYINSSQRLQRQVPAGAFDLTEVPLVTGQGEVRMVVRDLLGREQVVVQPYYVSPSLLRPGLHAYSYELGVVREDYGLVSNRYGRVLATATDRLGISERFTRELRAEVLGRQRSAGATGLWLLPAFGTVNLSAVGSDAPRGTGALLGAGAERQAPDWSGSVQLRAASRRFSQAGEGPTGAPRLSLSIGLGTTWRGSGIGVSYLQQDGWRGESHRIVAVNTARQLGRLGTLGVVALRDHATGGYTLAVSLSHTLDDRSMATASATRSRDAGQAARYDSVQLQRNLPDGPGLGYQVSAERGVFDRYTAQAAWQTERAVLSAGVARAGQNEEARAGASGGLAWLGDSVFLSRRIDGSFAVVEVADYPGVQLLHDNRPAARTDPRGRALVSGLRGYEANRISIDPADLPFDADVDALEALVTPPARSGVALRLGVERVRSASFRLVGSDGTALPPGSALRIAGSSRSFPIGFDGKAFVSGLAGRTRVQARWPGHECSAWLPDVDDRGEVPELGTVRCE